MDHPPKSSPAGRLALALSMADFGIALMRSNLRRRFPEDTDAKITARLSAWIEGPPPIDRDLRAVPWPK